MPKSPLPHPPAGGQNALLKPETQERILDAVRAGMSWKLVAAYAGIGFTTLMDWRRRGRRYQAIFEGDEQVEDLKARRIWQKADQAWTAGNHQAAYAWLAALDAHTEMSPELPYYRLLIAIEEASAATAVEMGLLVRRGAREDPHLALKWLQARYPQDWSPNRPVETDDDLEQRKHEALEKLREIREQSKAQ